MAYCKKLIMLYALYWELCSGLNTGDHFILVNIGKQQGYNDSLCVTLRHLCLSRWKVSINSRLSLSCSGFFTITFVMCARLFASWWKKSVVPVVPLFLLFGFFSRGFTHLISLSNTCLSVPPLFRRPSCTSFSTLPRRDSSIAIKYQERAYWL